MFEPPVFVHPKDIEDLTTLFEKARAFYDRVTYAHPGSSADPAITNRQFLSGFLDSAERLGCVVRQELLKKGVDFVVREKDILESRAAFTKAAAIEVMRHVTQGAERKFYARLPWYRQWSARIKYGRLRFGG